MKNFIFSIFLLLAASDASASKGSAGIVLATPEIFGTYASYWPTDDLSLDGRLTLSTVEGGVTAHIGIMDSVSSRHDLLVTAMAGYVHDAVRNGTWHAYHGPHFIGAAGYGYQGGWDVRLLAGITTQPTLTSWSTGFTAYAMVGHSF